MKEGELYLTIEGFVPKEFVKVYPKCACCGELLVGTSHESHDGRICTECKEIYYSVCYCCRKYVHRDRVGFDADDHVICPKCLASHYGLCSHCNKFFRNSELSKSEDGKLFCEDCITESGHLYCDGCGRVFLPTSNHNIGQNYYCNRCLPSYIIRDYSYKPTPIFHGTGNRFFGIELEVEQGNSDISPSRMAVQINRSQLYFKYDGSLSCGVEIVSHPCTPEYHKSELGWSELLQTLRRARFNSHNSGNCGLHIHVNRTALGSSSQAQHQTVARMLVFMERFHENIKRISRRRNIGEWSRLLNYGERSQYNLDRLYTDYTTQRYNALNLQNTNTVELRIFRGTLKKKSFISAIEFFECLIDIGLNETLESLTNSGWDYFMDTYFNNTRYLKDYIALRLGNRQE